MINIDTRTAQATAPNHEGKAVEYDSVPELLGLLAQAARIAAGAGMPPDAFGAAAWQAYLAASPGLAERLAEMQFDAALEELRRSGGLAKA